MRRRTPELRRPGRRKLLRWIGGLLLVIFLVALLVLFVVHHHHQDPWRPPTKAGAAEIELPQENYNFTQELLSTTSFSRQLSDQMTLAKAYLVIAKERNNLQLAWEFSSQIRNCQRLLSQAAVRHMAITLEEAHPIVSKLSSLIYKAQDAHYDLSTTIETLKKHTQALEGLADAAVVQSAEFGRLASESVPRNLHCLSIKLGTEWHRNGTLEKVASGQRSSPRLVDNNLYHFCIFSDNMLAASAVVNSTVSNADHPRQLVFHVVTSEVNYRAMAAWFLTNGFGGCTIEVRSTDEFSWLNSSYSPLVRRHQRKLMNESEDKDGLGSLASLISQLLFYIPEIYPFLEKVVLLDEDVVVRKDLTPLFSLDLHGNANGAVETCLESSSHRLHKYLNFSNPSISRFDPQACGWASGMNVFDLVAWRKANLTAVYHGWEEQNAGGTIWQAGGGALAPALLTFYGRTEPLDQRWHVLGLGYDPDVDDRLIESAAVVHFNGNLKPWTRLGIARYKWLWEQYVNQSHPYIKDCNMY